MLASEIRQRLSRYLAQELSLTQFEEWFIPVAWEVSRSDEPDAVDLAGTIKLKLAEFTSGHWTEDELRGQLIPLVTRYEVRTGNAVLTTCSPEIMHVAIPLSGSFVDIRSVEAFSS